MEKGTLQHEVFMKHAHANMYEADEIVYSEESLFKIIEKTLEFCKTKGIEETERELRALKLTYGYKEGASRGSTNGGSSGALAAKHK